MIIGQDKAISYLNKVIKNKKLGNSFLFFGPAGVGKKTAARWFAKKINCICEKDEDKPCGACSSCVKIEKAIHPDIFFISPDGLSIKIEQTRAMLDGVLFRPFEGKYKVYIIEDAEKLTNSACNQMLKVLEEPPAYMVIILVISDITNLPPTVTSRCQRVPFNYISSVLIKDYVKSNFEFEKEKLTSLTKLSGGSLGRAVSFINDKHFWDIRDYSLKLASNFINMDYAEALKQAEKIEEFKGSEELILEFLIDWFRDLMVLKETKDFNTVINYDMQDLLQKNSLEYTVLHIKKIIRNILESKQLLRRNVNKKIIFNNLFLKLCAPHPSLSPGGED